jgi:hypothetical protein
MSLARMFAIGAFTLVFVVIGMIEVAARRPGSNIPTLGALCGFVMRYQVRRLPVGRIAVLGFWWWLGWHVFAR